MIEDLFQNYRVHFPAHLSPDFDFSNVTSRLREKEKLLSRFEIDQRAELEYLQVGRSESHAAALREAIVEGAESGLVRRLELRGSWLLKRWTKNVGVRVEGRAGGR